MKWINQDAEQDWVQGMLVNCAYPFHLPGSEGGPLPAVASIFQEKYFNPRQIFLNNFSIKCQFNILDVANFLPPAFLLKELFFCEIILK